jgi:hypothetical protein
VSAVPPHRRRCRATVVCALALAGSLLAGCGGGHEPASHPEGSPENPLVGRTAENAREGGREPGYQALVDGQSRAPASRFTPCNLVTGKQARAIVGAPIEPPLDARQGPTCIYRSRDGTSFVTLAVQQLDFGKLRTRIRQREKVDVRGRDAYCGTFGQPMLYLPLPRGEVLSIAGQCALARKFAAQAVSQLPG